MSWFAGSVRRREYGTVTGYPGRHYFIAHLLTVGIELIKDDREGVPELFCCVVSVGASYSPTRTGGYAHWGVGVLFLGVMNYKMPCDVIGDEIRLRLGCRVADR